MQEALYTEWFTEWVILPRHHGSIWHRVEVLPSNFPLKLHFHSTDCLSAISLLIYPITEEAVFSAVSSLSGPDTKSHFLFLIWVKTWVSKANIIFFSLQPCPGEESPAVNKLCLLHLFEPAGPPHGCLHSQRWTTNAELTQTASLCF